MKPPKRPTGRSAGLPTRPTEPMQQGRAKLQIPKPAKRVKSAKVDKGSLKREQRRLDTIRNVSRAQRKHQTRQLASEVRRFTSATRKRRIIWGTSFATAGILLSILLATWFTPILAIQKIEIIGLNRLNEKTVAKAVSDLVGTPLTLVDENQIALRLQNFPLIESFSTVSNPPHTLELRIVERHPIAMVQVSGQPYLFDAAGVQVGQASEKDNLPMVIITGNPAKSKNYRQAIDVLLSLPIELNNRIASIRALSKDNVQLTLTGSVSRTVIWGDSSQSILKSKVLSALLKTTRRNISVIFDVSSPEAPAVRYLNY